MATPVMEQPRPQGAFPWPKVIRTATAVCHYITKDKLQAYNTLKPPHI